METPGGRAVTLVIPHLRSFNYATNDPATDLHVGAILERLAATSLLARGGGGPTGEVRQAFPSMSRSILTEIY
eukprot:COSAG01_NODE_6562_length_3608_cov_4.538900_3_plen_73_part_00